jgi:ribosomal protein L10
MDGEVVDPANWETLEKLPTKQELIQRLAIALNTPATKLAQTINMVPTKLAVAIKALSELDGDKTLTVEEAAKRKAEKGD